MRTITIDAGIDIKQTAKDLAVLEKKIAKFKADIERKSAQRLDISSDMDNKSTAYEDSMKKVEALKNLSNDALKQMYTAGQDPAQLIAEEEKRAKELWKDYNKAAGAVDKINEGIAQTAAQLAKAEGRAGELREGLSSAYGEANGLAAVGAKVDSVFNKIGKRLRRLAARVMFFSVAMMALRQMRSYFSDVIRGNDEAAAAVGKLKGAFQTLAQPLMQAVLPAIVAITNWLTRVLTAITMLIAKLTGKKFSDFQKDAKEIKDGKKENRSMASFDTINKISTDNDTGEKLEATYEMAELTDEEFNGILATVALIGAALAAWKFPIAGLNFLAQFAGYLTIILGLIMFVTGYFDAWNNGISFDNLIRMIAGIGIAVAALGVMFGPVAAGIAIIIAGVALLVLGFRDVIKNGANLKNVLTVIAGVIMTGLGIAILTGSFIPLLIAAIVGIVLAVVALGGEFEGLAKGVELVFGGIIKFFKGAFAGDWEMVWEGIIDIFKGAWNILLAVVGGIVNAIVKGLNWLIDKMNTISFDVPDWVPLIGGKTLGINIPSIPEWDVPYLAKGAVIPPNRQFLAVLGDQKSGTNIEAPLDTIVAAFKQAQGGQNVNINFTGDLAALARVLAPVITYENDRRGGSVIAGGNTW